MFEWTKSINIFQSNKVLKAETEKKLRILVSQIKITGDKNFIVYIFQHYKIIYKTDNVYSKWIDIGEYTAPYDYLR